MRNLLDMAERLEGMPRHSSTHAAGVVITKEPLDNYVPVSYTHLDVYKRQQKRMSL